jgi:BirA family biotin operon repressor/biotin-[acetyl-CoA-carboxylase] ligase
MKANELRQALQARLTTDLVGQRLEWHQEIDSTNTRAVELARMGAPEGTLVLAELQTQGRGRLKRQWYAPTGSSLLMSLILRPELLPHQAQRATMICSLGLAEAIHQVTGLQAQLKWPNDLLLNGKKVGGILTELAVKGSLLEHVIVGMGLNVNLDVTQLPSVIVPATGLALEAGRSIPRLDLLAAALECIEVLYLRMKAGWSPHRLWRERLVTLGQEVRVGTREEIIEGTAQDVDPDGALLIHTEDGELRRVMAGDVTLRGHLVDEE